MAPKRKSTPAQNPLHSGASSSSNSAPLSLWFRDDDAHKAFSEDFSRRGIHSERQVVLSDFADTDLPFVIHNRGWESLCDVSVTCPFVLIQEFYSNMHGIDHSILGMAILPRPTWPALPRFAPCGFSPPRKGGGAGMGQDFRPAPWGGAKMGLHFLDLPRPAPPPPLINKS